MQLSENDDSTDATLRQQASGSTTRNRANEVEQLQDLAAMRADVAAYQPMQGRDPATERGYDAQPDNAENGSHTPLTSARALLQRRLMPIPVPFGEKNPARPGWQNERYDHSNVADAFAGQHNIGVRVGYVHDGLLPFVDCDLDTLEAVCAARFYLPDTGMKWGHKRKPCSHYGYYLTSAESAEHEKFDDPMMAHDAQQHATLCELRWTGQTIVPYSLWRDKHDHNDTEWVRWEGDGDGLPATVTYATLRDAMRHVAAVALLARSWRDGLRHVAALPLAGLFYHGEMSEDDATRFMRALCAAAHDEQADDRLRAVRDTYANGAAGRPITGGPTLSNVFDERMLVRLRDWLALGSGLPRIVVSGRPMRQIEEAARSAFEMRQRDVPERERIYKQYGKLIWLREHTDKQNVTQLQIDEMQPASLAVELSYAADFFSAGRGRPPANGSTTTKLHHVMPPERVVRALALSRAWQLDELNVVTSAPIVHADGSVVTTASYDHVTRSLYWPRHALTLPEIAPQPTEQQALTALATLREPFVDFPLDEESRTHTLALLLTLILRRVLTRYVPMAAITASDQGYGKTLLIDTCYRIASGAPVSYVSVPRTEEEWGKQIVSWLTAGRDVIALDNVEHALQSDELERVLTLDEYSRRALGTMQTATAPNEAVWIIAGNNLVLQGALPRRVYRIALSGLVNPLERPSTFAHDPLLDWIDGERPRLLAAAYTLYRYWLTHGCPRAPHGRVLTSFESWSHLIGGLLALVGVEDFLLTAREQMAQIDPTRGEVAEFMRELLARYGVNRRFRITEVCATYLYVGRTPVEEDGSLVKFVPSEWHDALYHGSLQKRLGHALNKLDGRVFDQHRFVVHRTAACANEYAFYALDREQHTTLGSNNNE